MKGCPADSIITDSLCQHETLVQQRTREIRIPRVQGNHAQVPTGHCDAVTIADLAAYT
jgi:hypothetical protein